MGAQVAVDGELSVEAYLNRWLGHMKGRLRPKTHEGYQGMIRLCGFGHHHFAGTNYLQLACWAQSITDVTRQVEGRIWHGGVLRDQTSDRRTTHSDSAGRCQIGPVTAGSRP